ncbi:methyltransferase domain-containing protein [Rhodococcus sp. BP-349]|jgi:2-polyprenyl-3-methyl-5-hydroxy-6-metoxy-1,4-benzoquinol methylase|uniref:class I SAM-dependent methyltransferase n=1 Tax=unclassified Rhodococcus (in: high G+C Gram-positive bacteria) TaxID=192944 RepID=UPI000481E504|nr:MULTISPECIES: methyltransferase domain-containing protein [unclassified Rhodococcus (in: high G+C Gram-positive bacteria)]KQU39514.1 methyltransferase [Rhodococcus sp. Leaf225]KQU43950.1 methyltransferase [Rhodococcus sp. Leaf258]MBY6538553.1 methyltransferase domain-containing protein [Rhodococcus sp. BP-363]MBY6542890.1 methyltransferase domain-containing protein [Rhodococcus sp. BP-369]MBY6562120.1 methyltransferase domain-containing protein [Rhodococcus sp. BP-370]
MLTMDFDRLGFGAGDRVIDIGCGQGRHSYELYRRGAHVTAFDQNADELDEVKVMFGAMAEEKQVPESATAETVVGDALSLPFPDEWFDGVIVSEMLEHVPDDASAIAEIARVVRPGGTVAVSVPRWLPERVCWSLSDEYHANEGGHVRIYRASELAASLTAAGLEVTHTHHAHALHAPYWWLKCAVGVRNDDHPLVRGYHSMLVWDMMKAPRTTRVLEQVLNPVIGKSVVIYLRKPETGIGGPGAGRGAH